MEYITLYNPEVYDVDIGNFRIESAGTAFKRNLTFPANTIIPADCFFLIGEEDAVDMNGNPPDLISWLVLQNGDQNDPDAYYYGAESPTDGVRLTGPKVNGVATVIDTVLWNSPNTNNLPGDAHGPAQSDEFIPDTESGMSLRRKIAGYDTDDKSDWKESEPKKISSGSGVDPDCDGLTTWEEIHTYYTDPINPDTDNDGMGDGDEVWHGYDPNDANSVPPSFADANIRKFLIKSGDFNGDGQPDISIFRPSSGLWAINGITRVYFGTGGDIPMPADYNGDGASDICIFRPSTGLWWVRDLTRVYFGNQTDLPVPGDYNGNGTSLIGIFRPSSGLWSIRNLTRVYFGTTGDVPVPADYDGDGTTDIAIYRPSEALWSIRNVTSFSFGEHMDIPTILDYNGDGSADIAAFRPSTGDWLIRGITTIAFGSDGDLPIHADYNGDGTDELAIFRPLDQLWNVRGVTQCTFGSYGDIPTPADYDGNGAADIAVFQPESGTWVVKDQTQYYYGTFIDIPVTAQH